MSTGGDLLKVFNYGTSNAAASRTNGRLESAERYNYVVGPPLTATVMVKETYAYGGRQGRASSRKTQMTVNGSPTESFTQSWTWNALGDLGSINYPVCEFTGCTAVSRSISPGYTKGFLTSVPGWGSLSYHANGMINQVTHSNGVVDTQANDPNGMKRPSAISSARGTTTLWSSGTYAYDGTGNVVKTGSGYFLYDRVSRLLEGHVDTGATGGGTPKWQSYEYDGFGNIKEIGGTSGRSTPTSASTNRQNGTGSVYDAAGNLIAWNGNTYQYDAFNQMTRMKSGAEDWLYLYTAGDERFWSYRVGNGGSLWALRDLDGKVLREYEAHAGWSAFKDYIYRGSQLLGSSHSTAGDRHLHLDHLGTPRLITAAGGGGDFYTLSPCRALDTRDTSAPFTAGETRQVNLVGICGIPSNATALSVNITVIDATATGEMIAWPANESQPTASAISYQAGLNRANNGILKLGNGALKFDANQLTGTAHLVLDVNGYFTEGAGSVVAYHAYYPFGEEATAIDQDTEQMKFTGHERDLASLAGPADDLDYMHARHASPLTGRFLSVDPVRGEPSTPQSWNRYSYVLGNPMAHVDPDGETWIIAGAVAHQRQFESLVNAGLHGQELKIGEDGKAALVSNGIAGPPSPEQQAFGGQIQAIIGQEDVVRQTLSSGTPTMIGSFNTGDIDVLDMGNLNLTATEPDSAVGSIAHELAEQNAKQAALANGKLREAMHASVHPIGTEARGRATGWRTISSKEGVETYQRGSVQKTIIYVFEKGNLVRREQQ